MAVTRKPGERFRYDAADGFHRTATLICQVPVELETWRIVLDGSWDRAPVLFTFEYHVGFFTWL